MARPPKLWFRMYVEAFSDPKMTAMKPEYRFCVIALFGAARISPEPGKLLVAPGVPHTIKTLARFADVDPRVMANAITAARKLGVVGVASCLQVGVQVGTQVGTQVDCFIVEKFAERQYSSDTSTERTQAYRARKTGPALRVVTSQDRHSDVTVTAEPVRGCDVPETETETEPKTEPKKNTSPSERKARKRATRIPEGYKPNQLTITGVDEMTARRELEKFRDYWTAQPGSKGVKQDWEATWRNWLRRVAEQRTKPTAVANPAFGGW